MMMIGRWTRRGRRKQAKGGGKEEEGEEHEK